MSSTDETISRIGGVAFTREDSDEDAQIEFMARRLGYTRWIFMGYNYEELKKWADSHGAIGDSRIRISTKCVDTIGALALALILMESDELRRDVFSILNQHADHMATKENRERQRPKRD